MLFECADRIDRAGRLEPAGRTQPRAQQQTVGLDGHDEYAPDHVFVMAWSVTQRVLPDVGAALPWQTVGSAPGALLP